MLAALATETKTLERARQDVQKELRRAQAAAEAVASELEVLQAMGVAPTNHKDREAAVAYVTVGAKAELEQVATRTAELAEITDSVDSTAVIEEVSQARAANPVLPNLVPPSPVPQSAVPPFLVPPSAECHYPSAAIPVPYCLTASAAALL